MVSTISDVEKALTEARELEDFYISQGWQSLQLEEEVVIKEIFVNIQCPSENVDPEVLVHIELDTKMYIVPLADVSAIHINDSLVIGVEDLYPDWQERVESRLGQGIDIIHHVEVVGLKSGNWDRYTYLSPVDGKIRVVSELI